MAHGNPDNAFAFETRLFQGLNANYNYAEIEKFGKLKIFRRVNRQL